MQRQRGFCASLFFLAKVKRIRYFQCILRGNWKKENNIFFVKGKIPYYKRSYSMVLKKGVCYEVNEIY